MPSENQELRNAGLKVTLPRVKILHILEQGNPHHMSAEDVYKSLLESGDDVGLATVYRVLTQFHDAGLVQRHNFDSGHSVFELVRGDHHDHILCIDCGRVAEFHDAIIEQRQQQIAEDMGYELKDHSLHLFAHCRKPQCPYLPSTAAS